jgi:hypothetical protein
MASYIQTERRPLMLQPAISTTGSLSGSVLPLDDDRVDIDSFKSHVTKDNARCMYITTWATGCIFVFISIIMIIVYYAAGLTVDRANGNDETILRRGGTRIITGAATLWGASTPHILSGERVLGGIYYSSSAAANTATTPLAEFYKIGSLVTTTLMWQHLPMIVLIASTALGGILLLLACIGGPTSFSSCPPRSADRRGLVDRNVKKYNGSGLTVQYYEIPYFRYNHLPLNISMAVSGTSLNVCMLIMVGATEVMMIMMFTIISLLSYASFVAYWWQNQKRNEHHHMDVWPGAVFVVGTILSVMVVIFTSITQGSALGSPACGAAAVVVWSVYHLVVVIVLIIDMTACKSHPSQSQFHQQPVVPPSTSRANRFHALQITLIIMFYVHDVLVPVLMWTAWLS